MLVRTLAALAVAWLALAAPGPATAQAEDPQTGPALPLDGAAADAFRRRGDAYRDAGDYERALADYGEAIAKGADDLESRFSRAEVLAALNRHREAVADYTAVLDKRPDDGEAHTNRALSLAQLQNEPGPGFRSRSDYELALLDFDAALKLLTSDFHSARLRFWRADLLAQRNEDGRALADFEAAAKLEPDNVQFLYRLSHARREAGDAAGAKAALETAAKLPWDQSWSETIEQELAALRPPGEPPPPAPSVALKVRKAETVVAEDGLMRVRITLEDEASKRLAEFSTANIGRMVEAVSGDEVLISAALREPLLQSSFDLSGAIGQGEMEALAKRLNGGEITMRVRQPK